MIVIALVHSGSGGSGCHTSDGSVACDHLKTVVGVSPAIVSVSAVDVSSVSV